MDDTEPQTAAAKVLWHFTMSLDGFVAGPEHDMHWLTGVAVRPGLIEEYTRTTGAVLAGRIEQAHRSALILTFGGGTNEMQRDLVATLALHLPTARRH